MQTHGLRAVSVLVPVEDVQLRADAAADFLILGCQIGKLTVGVEYSNRLGHVLVVAANHITFSS